MLADGAVFDDELDGAADGPVAAEGLEDAVRGEQRRALVPGGGIGVVGGADQERGAVEVRGGAEVSSLAQSFKVLGYFALWYALNVVYNIKNKQVCGCVGVRVFVWWWWW